MDALHSVLKAVDYNRWKVGGFVAAVFIMALLVGCPIKTASVLRPGEQVDAVGLQQEAAIIEANHTRDIKLLEIGAEDLQAQRDRRGAVLGVLTAAVDDAAAGTLTTAGGINVAVTLLSILVGAGSWVDKRRTDKKWAEAKANTEAPAEDSG